MYDHCKQWNRKQRHQLCSRKCTKHKIFCFFFFYFSLWYYFFMFICIFTYSFSAWIILFTRPRHFFSQTLPHSHLYDVFLVLTINLQGCLSLLSTAWVRITIENAVMFQGCFCIGRVVKCPVPFSQIGSKLSICTKAKNIQFHLWRAYEMLYFLLVFSPKKVSKHLCSYNRMSLVLIGCMKLDLFAMGAKFLLAVFFLLYNIMTVSGRTYVSLNSVLIHEYFSSFFFMLLVFLGWSAFWLYFSSHSFTVRRKYHDVYYHASLYFTDHRLRWPLLNNPLPYWFVQKNTKIWTSCSSTKIIS